MRTTAYGKSLFCQGSLKNMPVLSTVGDTEEGAQLPSISKTLASMTLSPPHIRGATTPHRLEQTHP